MNDFYKNVIPRSGLPVDFGGDLPSVSEQHEQFKNEYDRLREYFRAEEEQRGSYWVKIISKKTNKKHSDEKHEPEIIQNFQKLDID